MARQRDHAREYKQRKDKARALGFTSERQYKRARKASGIGRRERLPPVAALPKEVREYATREQSRAMSKMRRDAATWSRAHSKSRRSRYRRNMSDDEVRRYYATFVEGKPNNLSRRQWAPIRRDRLKDWLVPAYIDEAEWSEKYPPL